MPVLLATCFAAMPWPAAAQYSPRRLELLPAASAFLAPIADPTQPRLSAALVRSDIFLAPLHGQYHDAIIDAGDSPETHAMVQIGGSVPLLALHLEQCRLTAGVQAGVVARFRGRGTQALSNDWLAAAPLEAQCGRVSTQLRFYHRSDHLNDEFLLQNRIQRWGPVRDGVDLTLAWQPLSAARLYAGAGRILRGYFGPHGGTAHASMELGHAVYPRINAGAAYFVRVEESTQWRAQHSTLAFLELRPHTGSNSVRLALRDQRGPSTIGEFFRSDEHAWGVEVQVGLTVR